MEQLEPDRLYRELKAYGTSGVYPLHMPGHKRQMPDAYSEGLRKIAEIDVTEVEGTDNLHDPEGILRDAQMRAAQLYGARESTFLVNGSTAGILTALSAAAPRGSEVIVARNCHRSVYHGIYLRQLQAHYLWPSVIEGCGLADAISTEQVIEAVKAYPDAKAVLITSPTYDGILSDVRAIAEAVHAAGMVLIVDAAHGAHLGFSELGPESPVHLGADLVIMSVHKTLPALTQTALLHRCSDRVDSRTVRRFETIYQTSSPSYILSSSIDACVGLMAAQGRELMDDFYSRMQRIDEQLQDLKVLRIVLTERDRSRTKDSGKLLVQAGKAGGGFALYKRLLEEFGLQAEMAGDTCVTFILTPWDSEEGLTRMVQALHSIDQDLQSSTDNCPESCAENDSDRNRGADRKEFQESPAAALPIYEALDLETELRPLRECAGRVCGEYINLYPPGIPMIVPGEIYTEALIERIEESARMGLHVQGIKIEESMITAYVLKM